MAPKLKPRTIWGVRLLNRQSGRSVQQESMIRGLRDEGQKLQYSIRGIGSESCKRKAFLRRTRKGNIAVRMFSWNGVDWFCKKSTWRRDSSVALKRAVEWVRTGEKYMRHSAKYQLRPLAGSEHCLFSDTNLC